MPWDVLDVLHLLPYTVKTKRSQSLKAILNRNRSWPVPVRWLLNLYVVELIVSLPRPTVHSY